MSRFAAPWDRTLRVTTAAVPVLLGTVVAALAWVLPRAGAPAAVAGGAVALVGGLSGITVAATWALAPRAFAVEGGAIRIERRLREIAIPLHAVRSAGLLPAGALRRAVRLGGSGGLFGYYGRFWSRSLGAFRLYATRRDGLVRIDTADERFVLSPDAPERFLGEVLSRAPQAASEASVPPVRGISRRTKLALAAAMAVVPLAVGAVLAASWAGAPVAARVSPEAVIIERRWRGPIEIPLVAIRSAGVLSPAGLCGARRVAGYSGTEVHYGRFRTEALGGFQLYAWRRGPAVLLETSGGPVVLTPDEPDRFVAEVVRAVEARSRGGDGDDRRQQEQRDGGDPRATSGGHHPSAPRDPH
jgi:hypothetical protein